MRFITLIDKWVAVDEPMLNLGKQLLAGTAIFISNFAQNDGFDVHPNIATKYRVIRSISERRATIIDDEMADLDLRCECGHTNIKGDADDQHRYIAAMRSVSIIPANIRS